MRKNIIESSQMFVGKTARVGLDVFTALPLPLALVSFLRLMLRAWIRFTAYACGLPTPGNAGTSYQQLDRQVTNQGDLSFVAAGNSPSLGDCQAGGIGLIAS